MILFSNVISYTTIRNDLKSVNSIINHVVFIITFEILSVDCNYFFLSEMSSSVDGITLININRLLNSAETNFVD
jgi:hypothetical protein